MLSMSSEKQEEQTLGTFVICETLGTFLHRAVLTYKVNNICAYQRELCENEMKCMWFSLCSKT